MPHLFLTGEKQIGKSTLINEILKDFQGSLGGFRTVRTDQYLPDKRTVHLLRAEGDMPCEENLLFYCGNVDQKESTNRFDRLGTEILSPIICELQKERNEQRNLPEIILMDELGPKEEDAHSFQSAVKSLLFRRYPQVLGVLQKADSAFLNEIKEMRHVIVVEITEENRDHILPELKRYFFHYNEIPSYGAIVIEKKENADHVLMVGGYRGWSFPKGHIDIGETPEEAAYREILEEAGIETSIDSSFAVKVPSALPKDKNSVTFFLGRSKNGIVPPTAQVEEVRQAAWIPVNEAIDLIGYEPDKQALIDAISYLKS